MQPQAVLEVLTQRIQSRQADRPYQDSHRLALAVAGGGMRGVISMGMLIALQDLDVIDLFDVYTGISAGALNLAYLLAGQGALGLSVYFDDMTNPDYLRVQRLRNKEHPVMDMRRIYTDAINKKPLKVENLQNRYARDLHVAVSNVTTNSGELITLNSSGDRFYEYLIAGATIPLVAGDPWRINNQDYYDGGLFYIDPVHCVQALDCSHALVLSTNYEGYVPKPHGRLAERIIRRLADDYHNAGEHYLEGLTEWCQVASLLPWRETELNGIQLYRLAPHDKTEVGRITNDYGKLLNGMRMGYKSVLELFQIDRQVGILPTIMS